MTPTTLVPRPVAPAADLEQQEQRVPGDRARHQQGASAAARIWVKLLGPPSEVIMARAPTTTSPHRAPTTIATSSDTSSLSRLAAPPASTATIKPSGKTIRSGKRVAAGIAAPMIPMPAMSASVGPPGWAPSTAHPAPQEAINIPALPTATESRRFCASVPRTNWVRNIRMIPTPRPGATQSRLGPPGPQSPNSVAAVETTKSPTTPAAVRAVPRVAATPGQKSLAGPPSPMASATHRRRRGSRHLSTGPGLWFRCSKL